MTKKDINRIAAIIRSIREYDPDADYHRGDIAWVFAHELTKDDPSFDKSKFEKACMRGHRG